MILDVPVLFPRRVRRIFLSLTEIFQFGFGRRSPGFIVDLAPADTGVGLYETAKIFKCPRSPFYVRVDYLWIAVITTRIRTRYLHARSWSPVPSSIRIVGDYVGSWTMTYVAKGQSGGHRPQLSTARKSDCLALLSLKARAGVSKHASPSIT